jgi:hypothetical protein
MTIQNATVDLGGKRIRDDLNAAAQQKEKKRARASRPRSV